MAPAPRLRSTPEEVALSARILRAVWLRMPWALQRLVVIAREALFNVTTSAVLLDERGRVLLLAHVFRSPPWGIPGGFIGAGEQPEEAMRREVREETGLEARDLEVVSVRQAPGRKVEILFRGLASGDPRPDGFEISEGRWVDPAALPPDVDEDLRERIQRALHV